MIQNREEVILKRGSTTRFAKGPVSKDKLLTVLQTSNCDITSDIFTDSHSTNIDCYVNVHDIYGLSAGAYYYNDKEQKLKLIKKGFSVQKTTFLCLGQELFQSCQIVIFLLANIENLVQHFGDR